MTEAEFLVCQVPSVMPKAIETYERLRKLRLVACACCRHAWLRTNHTSDLRLVDAVERYVDGIDSVHALAEPFSNARDRATCSRCLSPTPLAIGQVMQAVIEPLHDLEAEKEYQCGVLRDVFAYRFHKLPNRPEAISPLAERIYTGEWELIPILGEWLQEHGYWSEGEHCLDPKTQHVKGCWVVDWVTGRE